MGRVRDTDLTLAHHFQETHEKKNEKPCLDRPFVTVIPLYSNKPKCFGRFKGRGSRVRTRSVENRGRFGFEQTWWTRGTTGKTVHVTTQSPDIESSKMDQKERWGSFEETNGGTRTIRHEVRTTRDVRPLHVGRESVASKTKTVKDRKFTEEGE